jgi:hypothetical protein
VYISNNERGEVHRNIDVIKVKNCTGEYKNKFTGQQNNFLGGRHSATLPVLFART